MSDSTDPSYDVIVVGFGGAGACAALEAHAQGARVLLIDRFAGGGATARSGGVVYLGGGSRQQKAAGYEDDPDQMYNYLCHEVGDAVTPETLRRYCDESLDHLSFLEDHGIPFPPQGDAPKTSYPEDDVTLYFSGNELCPPYNENARIAPRGHRVLGEALTGDVLFEHLRRAVEARDIEVRTQCEARELIADDNGRIVGLRIRDLPAGPTRRKHKRLAEIATGGGMLLPRLGIWAKRRLIDLEVRHGVESEVHVRGGVIISAGGFVFNRSMVRELAPRFSSSMPLGTIGDDGSGIRLGERIGGRTDRMERCGAWRFINPPVALTHGILVSRSGERFCNEELYGAKLGEKIAYEHDGRAYLVIDSKTRRRILAELREKPKLNFQSITALLNLFVNRWRAHTPEALAALCGMPQDAFSKTLDTYNERARSGHPDPLGKSEQAAQHVLDTPPYYAIVCDLDNRWFPTPTFTMGGLVVSGESGELLRGDGSKIEGVYAAGRSAVGISSESYVSGLSLGDCVFSGRGAARHAAARAAASRPAP